MNERLDTLADAVLAGILYGLGVWLLQILDPSYPRAVPWPVIVGFFVAFAVYHAHRRERQRIR